MITTEIEREDAVVLLALSKVPIADHSSLRWVLADTDPTSSSPEDLERRGLLVDRDGVLRPNAAVATALASLAQPDSNVEFHHLNAGGSSCVVASAVADHHVVLSVTDERLELGLTADRTAVVAGMRAGWGPRSSDELRLRFDVSPAAQFLIGVLARHGGQSDLGAGEVSVLADDDMAIFDRAVGTASLEPGCLDRMYRNPAVVAEELDQLVDVGAVVESRRQYNLEARLGSLLRSAPTAKLSVRRSRRGVTGLDGVDFVVFGNDIIELRTIRRDGARRVSIASVSSGQAAALSCSFLYSDDELAKRQQVS